MGRRLSWPFTPLPDGRGEVWRWDLRALGELPAARAGLRARLGNAGFPPDDEDESAEQLVMAFDELASNALRHGESPAVGRDPAQGGMGLHLVARLSVAHGWYVDAGIKHVWACLPSELAHQEPVPA